MTTGPIARLIMEGSIDGIQSWSCGLTCQAETTPTAEELADWLLAVEPHVRTWWSTTNGAETANKPTCTMQALGAYGYADIADAAASSAKLTLSPALSGTAASPYAPVQCSIVLTLKTDFTGRHNTGRIYLPATAGLVAANNRLSSALVGVLATSTAALCVALAAETVNGSTTSAVLVPSSGATQSRFVSGVSVGDIVDTQRRRRDKYVETRTLAPVSS